MLVEHRVLKQNANEKKKQKKKRKLNSLQDVFSKFQNFDFVIPKNQYLDFINKDVYKINMHQKYKNLEYILQNHQPCNDYDYTNTQFQNNISIFDGVIASLLFPSDDFIS